MGGERARVKLRIRATMNERRKQGDRKRERKGIRGKERARGRCGQKERVEKTNGEQKGGVLRARMLRTSRKHGAVIIVTGNSRSRTEKAPANEARERKTPFS